jgi:ADP-dependent NAD(P)H-hydrate dehydratase / NAD(P)H-hydrate epimerase
MPATSIPSVPVLSTDQALALEAGLFGGDERKEWKAIVQAGRSVSSAILRDFGEVGAFPEEGRVLVLAGNGNNTGDALIAARDILERHPKAEADVLFAFGPRNLKPLAARAWRGLSEAVRGRVHSVAPTAFAGKYDLCICGIIGFRFRPPLPPEASAAIEASSRCAVRFRAAVDLPTGWSEPGAFRADFTYATGSVKAPLLDCVNAGRPRYLDLGFFTGDATGDRNGALADRVIVPSILRPLSGLRRASSDKRSQGHLFVVGGSGSFPGAILLATLSALRSGAGLVTAFIPKSLVAEFAARAPEAIWMGMPETPGGGLAKGSLPLIMEHIDRASALLLGPGCGRDPETLSLALGIAKASTVPLVIDADALQPDIVRAGSISRILTPHAGEFKRIAKGSDLRELPRAVHGIVVRKGPVTQICDGGAVYHSFFGGPVLSRGGSGDVLAGLVGGLLAQTPTDPLSAACKGVVWHGMAADRLARARGQTAVQISQLLEHLGPVLREEAQEPA